MRRWTGWNNLVAFSALAVLAPVIVFSWLQYRSLRQLESKTRFAVRENLRTNLEELRRRVEERAVALAEEALRNFDATDLEIERAAETGQKFAPIRAKHPSIAGLFVVARCSCRKPFAVVSTGQGSGWTQVSRFDDPLVKDSFDSFRGARPLPGRPADDPGPLFFQSTGGEARSSILHVYRPLSRSGKVSESADFAAVAINTESLLREVLPGAARELCSRTGSSTEELAVAVTDTSGRSVCAIPPGAVLPGKMRAELVLHAGPVLPLFTLSGSFRGKSIDSLAHDQFRNGLLLSGAVLCLLILGIALSLKAATREARLAELKSGFVANVSHEMKTPLSLIKLYAETLEMGRVTDAEKLREYHRVIHKESCRLTQLVNNVLDFARMEAGRKQYTFRSADVGELVSDVVGTYQHQMAASGFQVMARIEHPLRPALVDGDAISQAVLNLLNNAIRYSADVKEVSVRVAERNGEIAITVADRGIGIPQSEQARIFEKFYRVNAGLVHDTKGSGLGLTLTKHVVEAHHGRIEVDSRPGDGSRFTIFLPVRNPGNTEDAASVPQREPVGQTAHY